jgi:hypothetical protein
LKSDLVGFDARLAGEWYLTGRWSPERRETFLLDPSVQWPLSVDWWVWPSLFRDEVADTLRRHPLDELLISPDMSDYRVHAIGLWTSASAMKRRVEEAHATDRSVPVAVELCSEHGFERVPDWNDRLGGASPCEPPRVGWPLLGFDVADIGYISALSNCGWAEDARAIMQQRWLPHLNEHGLFEDADAASDFLPVAEDLVSEHAPFFVYALRRCSWDEIS